MALRIASGISGRRQNWNGSKRTWRKWKSVLGVRVTMDGNELCEMLYQTDPDPLAELLFTPGDYGYVEMDASFDRGMEEACRNLNRSGGKCFFKRSEEQ
jgi:hypothetical protein